MTMFKNKQKYYVEFEGNYTTLYISNRHSKDLSTIISTKGFPSPLAAHSHVIDMIFSSPYQLEETGKDVYILGPDPNDLDDYSYMYNYKNVYNDMIKIRDHMISSHLNYSEKTCAVVKTRLYYYKPNFVIFFNNQEDKEYITSMVSPIKTFKDSSYGFIEKDHVSIIKLFGEYEAVPMIWEITEDDNAVSS